MANPDYKDFKNPTNTGWKRNPFVENRQFLGQDIGTTGWGLASLIWGVFQWGHDKHQERNLKWTKTVLAVLLFIGVAAYAIAGTDTNDLPLHRLDAVGDNYFEELPENMDTLDAAIPDKRLGKQATFYSEVFFEAQVRFSSQPMNLGFTVNIESATVQSLYFSTTTAPTTCWRKFIEDGKPKIEEGSCPPIP